MSQVIEPLDDVLAGDIDELLARKLNEVIEHLNHLLDVLPCHFVDGMCQIHNSPQIFVVTTEEWSNQTLPVIQPPSKLATGYCGVAEAKMRERIERSNHD